MKRYNYFSLQTLTTFFILSFSAFSVWACELKNTHLVPHKNGTVLDKQKNLTWMRCTLGQEWIADHCEGLSTRFPWWDLKKNVSTFNEEGGFNEKTDWRLPTKKELETLIEPTCFDPAINKTLFPLTAPSGYWASDVFNHSAPKYAWLVFFLHGQAYFSDKSVDWFVRLVRDEK